MSEARTLRLSPPWHTFFNFVKHAIGKDRQVKVLEMKEVSEVDFLIQIETKDKDKALALATILEPYKEFGNIKVYVEVLCFGKVVMPSEKKQNVCTLMNFYEKAFGANDYFVHVEFKDFFGNMMLFPVFKKEVIQFFNDNLADLYQNFNGVVADVFKEILRFQIDEVSIRPSTAVEKV